VPKQDHCYPLFYSTAQHVVCVAASLHADDESLFVWDTTKKAQDSERSAGESVSPRVHASDVIHKAPSDHKEDEGSMLNLSEVCDAEGTCVTHNRIPTPMPRVSGGKGGGRR
jgi:hypothetical protein